MICPNVARICPNARTRSVILRRICACTLASREQSARDLPPAHFTVQVTTSQTPQRVPMIAPTGTACAPTDRARNITVAPCARAKGPISTTTSSWSRNRMRDPAIALVRERPGAGPCGVDVASRSFMLKPASSSTSAGKGMGHNGLLSSPAF